MSRSCEGNTGLRNRFWCFTSFEKDPPSFTDAMNYLIYQRERCPSTLKEHWQGFVQLKKSARLAGVKKLVGNCHVESTKGSVEDNVAYCTKAESRVSDPVAFGKPVKQGERTDLAAAGALAIEGKWLDIDPRVYIKYHRGLKALAALHQRPVERKLCVTCYWGATGVGKSHRANAELPNAYWKPSGAWWDNYLGEKDVIIDDFDPTEHKCCDLLRWIDKWPLQVPVKGGFATMQAERIIVTSHICPLWWYPQRSSEVERRFTTITHLD